MTALLSAEALSPKEREKQALERMARFVEQKVLAATDERTRFIRLMVLAMTEVAIGQIKNEN